MIEITINSDMFIQLLFMVYAVIGTAHIIFGLLGIEKKRQTHYNNADIFAGMVMLVICLLTLLL